MLSINVDLMLGFHVMKCRFEFALSRSILEFLFNSDFKCSFKFPKYIFAGISIYKMSPLLVRVMLALISTYIYTYIYIYVEREIYIYIYIYEV